jgi:hypothetical protein
MRFGGSRPLQESDAPGRRIFDIHGNPIMTTSDLEKEGFLHWTAFNRLGKAELLRKVPSQFSVYVIRATKAIKRIHGEFDIVYIGSACNQNGLRGRISQYFSPAPTQITNKRILALIEESADYEIGWLPVAAKSRAVVLEQELWRDTSWATARDAAKLQGMSVTIRKRSKPSPIPNFYFKNLT